ncbi:hypothetical protein MD484_g6514, partial [Candolleomyces efflorescens]
MIRRMLIIEYVAATAVGNSANKAIERKDKRPLPIPVSFSSTLRAGSQTEPTLITLVPVVVVLLLAISAYKAASIAGIVCEHFKVLCTTEGYTLKYAAVYIECINFVSISALADSKYHFIVPSIALYGLLVFCGLVSEELKGKRPVAKFLAIKLVVMFTFYQMFVFHWLEGRVIHETTYWTTTNIANGLNALAICVEMVFFSALMLWAYTWKEYEIKDGSKKTGIGRPLLDSINMSDFIREIWYSLRYFFSGKTHTEKTSTVGGGVPLTKLRSTTDEGPRGGVGVGLRPPKSTGYDAYHGGGGAHQRLSFAQAFGLEPVEYANRSLARSNDHVDSTRTFGRSGGGGGAGELKKGLAYGHASLDDKEEREMLTRGMSPLVSSKDPDALQAQQELHYSHHHHQQQHSGKYGGKEEGRTYVVGVDTRGAKGKVSEDTDRDKSEEGGVDLGYYQSAYGGVEEQQQPYQYQQASYPPQSQLHHQQHQQSYSQQQQVYQHPHPRQLQPQTRGYTTATSTPQTQQVVYGQQQQPSVPPSLQPQQPVWSAQDSDSYLQPPQNYYESSGGGGGGDRRESYSSWAGPRAV